jgi:hypothetical protein
MKIVEITTFMTEPRQMELEGAQLSINGLSYERVPGRGVRFQFDDRNASPIGHMWFLRNMDLRHTILRVYYSGTCPLYVTFFISRSSIADRHIYAIRLEPADEPRSFDLTMPNKPAFQATNLFGFYFERRGASNKRGDFYIEKIEMNETPEHALYHPRRGRA